MEEGDDDVEDEMDDGGGYEGEDDDLVEGVTGQEVILPYLRHYILVNEGEHGMEDFYVFDREVPVQVFVEGQGTVEQGEGADQLENNGQF